GELASHSRKLEAIELRGRGLRAEIGRKVEELAGEESRARREAAAHEERSRALGAQRMEALRLFEKLESELRASSGGTDPRLYERLGGARARAETLSEVQREIERQAQERLRYADGLQQQIGDLRTQLGRYSEALEA